MFSIHSLTPTRLAYYLDRALVLNVVEVLFLAFYKIESILWSDIKKNCESTPKSLG
jgi:hypothetical protein